MTSRHPREHLVGQFWITEAASWVFAVVTYLLVENHFVGDGKISSLVKLFIALFAALAFFIHHILSKKISIDQCMMVEACVFFFFAATLVQMTGGSLSPFWILCYFPIVIALMILRLRFCLWILACTTVMSSVVIVRTFFNGRAEEWPILILNIFCLLTLTILSYLSAQEIVQERELKNKAISDRDRALLKSEQHLKLVEEKSAQIEEYSHKLAEANQELLQHQAHLLKLTGELEKANEDLKEMNEMKSDFVSMVSHELRTPLTAIKESVALLREDPDLTLSPEQKKFLEITQHNVERLTVLIQDILDFSKLESGKLKIKKEKCEVNEVLKVLEEFYEGLARKKEIQLEIEMPLPNHLYVYADGGRLWQILDNLLSNAIKFTPERGKISVAVERLEGSKVLGAIHKWEADRILLTASEMERLSLWGNFIVFTVRDTGFGIAQKDIQRIFEKFFQIDVHESRPRGTGLGLAIVKHLVLLHEGGFWVESELGKGTCFKVCLPVYEEVFKRGGCGGGS